MELIGTHQQRCLVWMMQGLLPLLVLPLWLVLGLLLVLLPLSLVLWFLRSWFLWLIFHALGIVVVA